MNLGFIRNLASQPNIAAVSSVDDFSTSTAKEILNAHIAKNLTLFVRDGLGYKHFEY